MRRLTVFLVFSCCCDFICFRAVAAKSAIEPAGDYIGIVPAPLETKRLQGKPIELGFTAVLIKKGSPVQHQYIAEQVRKDLVVRFGLNADVISDVTDSGIYDSYVILGEPKGFPLLKQLCASVNEKVDYSRPGKEGFLLHSVKYKDKPAFIIAGPDSSGVIYGGFAFVQLPFTVKNKTYCPTVSIIDRPSLEWRGAVDFYICTSSTTSKLRNLTLYHQEKPHPLGSNPYKAKFADFLALDDQADLDWLARCRYNAVLDYGSFWRNVNHPGVKFMIDECHKRGIKVCFAFSIECGPVETGLDCNWNYLDTTDPCQTEAFRQQIETVLKAGIDMLEIGFGDIPGSILESEKQRFKNQYEKGIYVCEEAAKIAKKYNVPIQIDSPFYYVVATDPKSEAYKYQKAVASSPYLTDSFYIDTITGGFDWKQPQAHLKAVKTLREQRLNPVYFFNGLRTAIGPTGGWSQYFSGAPRYGVPTLVDMRQDPYYDDALRSSKYMFRGFPYLEQTYYNPKPEQLRELPKYAKATWLESTGHFNHMLHATWAWSPERFEELRDRKLILGRMFGKNTGKLVEQWQTNYIKAIKLIYQEIEPNEVDPHRKNENWYKEGFRCYRVKNVLPIESKNQYQKIKDFLEQMIAIRRQIFELSETSEIMAPDSPVEVDLMEKTETYLMKTIAGARRY